MEVMDKSFYLELADDEEEITPCCESGWYRGIEETEKTVFSLLWCVNCGSTCNWFGVYWAKKPT